MDEKEKLDIFDFILNVLREHERSLDYLVEQLGSLIRNIQEIVQEIGESRDNVNIKANELLERRVKELENEIREYRAREVRCLDALSELYPLEEIIAAA